ncbi:MAG: CsoR family transcriptional regulator [Mesoaciditoga sp.]|nr:MAG: CsoR family transcriptional regulator [Mesoaciditoga sp.]PMP80890.1 MAG: CsoR family transcriptional regulator [Mesoaciditoga sp.]HEU23985.1 metal-sensing transcriptional repressor [Mesoaciditoga lauensis]
MTDHQLKHEEALKLLKTARGHIDAVIKMIEDDRYCVDISTQLLAIIALLKKANTSVINKHIETCVKDAIKNGDVDEKLKELETLMKYLEKSL